MDVFVFGNPHYEPDAAIFAHLSRLQHDFPTVRFICIDPNQDMPPEFTGKVILMDVVLGIESVTVIDESNIAAIQATPRFGVHDYDLGFQLKYLMKLKKITGFVIVGVPMGKPVSYDSIQLTLRKLVAQDIQGS